MKDLAKKIPKLQEYARKKEFTKLHDLLSQLNNQNLSDKDTFSLTVEKEKIYKNFLKFELKKSILSNQFNGIKIKILLEMSPKYILESKSSIKNIILRKFILEFQNKNLNVQSFLNLENTFFHLMELFNKLKFLYNEIPEDWNLKGDFLFYCVIHIKEILFGGLHQLFRSEISQPADGLLLFG